METHIKIEKTPVRDFFLRTIAVLGLIAILLLGAWGIIQLAFAIPNVFDNVGSGFSSLFTSTKTTTATSTKEAITVSLPGATVNNELLAVSWAHTNTDQSGQYSYALSYACQTGLSVKAPLPNGSYQTVPCNTPFNYVNASQHMNIVPILSGATQPLTVTVVATKLATGAISATGAATVNVAVGAVTTTPKPVTNKPTTVTRKPTTTYYPAATRAVNLYGYGDLAVRFTGVTPSNGVTVVQFVIENTGTNVINAGWSFNATLPINGSYTFNSQPQQALYPGDKIAYRLSFTGANSGSTYPYNSNASGYSTNGYNYNYNNYGYQTATITVTADPQNFVPEYNKSNNTAQTTVPLY